MRPALALLERLSIGGIESAPWSPAELRVEGVFDGSDVETILREPLVMALARRPKIDVSDERAAMSLTNFAPGTNPGKYKKWLGDLCEVCGNLSGDGYYVGLADLGIDGGSHAAAAQISGEPNASGLHRVDLRQVESFTVGHSKIRLARGHLPAGRLRTPRELFTTSGDTGIWLPESLPESQGRPG